MKRRHFLFAGGLISAGAYINHRALRYPRLSFEPKDLAKHQTSEVGQITFENFITLNKPETETVNLRAIAPEPKITIKPSAKDKSSIIIHASNLSPQAILRAEADPQISIHESIEGIHRIIEIQNISNNPIELAWYLPIQQLSFAAIGDSGGGIELDWCLRRANELGAQFILHLGDFNYGNGEYKRAIEQFNQSSIPVYVTIGNHDFNDSGLIYQQFLDQIGPQNHSFLIANTRFINLDTAVNFFPAYAGNRGRLAQEIKSYSSHTNNHLVFTHKPFIDSREGKDHDISGIGEKTWLKEFMNTIEAKNLLCGHVHQSSERDYEGIHQWTAGEGLGHEDLVHQKQISQILIGNISNNKDVTYKWHDLNMPWAMHQSHTHEKKLLKSNNIEQLNWYLKTIKNNLKTDKPS